MTDKEKASREPAHKYTVTHLAEALGVNALTTRNKLRTAGIEKDGATYGWDTKTAFEAVVKQLKAPKAEATDKPAKAKPTAKKAATGKAKPAAKKASSKPNTLKKKSKPAAPSEGDESEPDIEQAAA